MSKVTRGSCSRSQGLGWEKLACVCRSPELLGCSQCGWWPRPAGLVGSALEVLKTRRDDRPRVDEAEEPQLGVCQAGGEHQIGVSLRHHSVQLSRCSEAHPTDPSGPDLPNYMRVQLL